MHHSPPPGTLKLWDVATRKLKEDLPGHADEVLLACDRAEHAAVPVVHCVRCAVRCAQCAVRSALYALCCVSCASETLKTMGRVGAPRTLQNLLP